MATTYHWTAHMHQLIKATALAELGITAELTGYFNEGEAEYRLTGPTEALASFLVDFDACDQAEALAKIEADSSHKNKRVDVIGICPKCHKNEAVTLDAGCANDITCWFCGAEVTYEIPDYATNGFVRYGKS